ncbi:hypothetical protein BC826DRAFT_379802 [Russula brevipes]|nr:hypothetical protein BC826DRAFT_379802 [Russula brevipes]
MLPSARVQVFLLTNHGLMRILSCGSAQRMSRNVATAPLSTIAPRCNSSSKTPEGSRAVLQVNETGLVPTQTSRRLPTPTTAASRDKVLVPALSADRSGCNATLSVQGAACPKQWAPRQYLLSRMHLRI